MKNILKNGCDIVVANDKQQMKEANSHVAYIVRNDNTISVCNGKSSIASTLTRLCLNRKD